MFCGAVVTRRGKLSPESARRANGGSLFGASRSGHSRQPILPFTTARGSPPPIRCDLARRRRCGEASSSFMRDCWRLPCAFRRSGPEKCRPKQGTDYEQKAQEAKAVDGTCFPFPSLTRTPLAGAIMFWERLKHFCLQARWKALRSVTNSRLIYSSIDSAVNIDGTTKMELGQRQPTRS